MATSDSSRDAAQANIVPVNPATPPTSPFDVIRHTRPDGSEYWSAREMSPLLGYAKWQNFQDVLRRARLSCKSNGFDPSDHFTDVSNMVPVGSGAQRGVVDVHLTRHACHLTAMNGDVDKIEVAAAQTYFSIQTRRAELHLSPLGAAPVCGPWGKRLEETIVDHLRHLRTRCRPGSWTVVSELVAYMLIVEDEFTRCFLPVVSGDRWDVSVGLIWSGYRKGKPWAGPVRGVCPLWLPDQCLSVQPCVYFPPERVHFMGWLMSCYFPEKLPNYAARKFPQCRHGLNAYRAVDGVCLRCADRPARLPSHIRGKLSDRSGPTLPGLFGPDVPQLA